MIMFVTNSTLRTYSSYLENLGVSHYASNELIGKGATNIRLLTIWGAKGGQAHTTALITDSEMDVRMLVEDPRLEYVAHSRAQYSFYYVGDYIGNAIPSHSSEKIDSNIDFKKMNNTIQPSIVSTNTQEISTLNSDTLKNLVDKFSKSKNS